MSETTSSFKKGYSIVVILLFIISVILLFAISNDNSSLRQLENGWSADFFNADKYMWFWVFSLILFTVYGLTEFLTKFNKKKSILILDSGIAVMLLATILAATFVKDTTYKMLGIFLVIDVIVGLLQHFLHRKVYSTER